METSDRAAQAESGDASTMSNRSALSLLLSALWAALLLTALPRPASCTMPPLSGPVPRALAQAFEDGLFALPEPAGPLRTSAVQTTWRLPVLLVSFSDDTLTHGAAEFDTLLFDTRGGVPTGSVYDYYQWVSRGRMSVTGRVVARVRLANPLAYYAGNSGGLSPNTTPHNSLGVVRDALALCQSQVNWPEFDIDRDGYVDMVWVVHAGLGGEAAGPSHLWSITSRMTGSWFQQGAFVTSVPVPGGAPGQTMRLDRFTILPELSPFEAGAISEIGVFCHEFGHALGLPDLYDVSNAANTGPGNWSLMSSGAYGGDGLSPESPTHLGAWPLQFLGWDSTVRPARDTTMLLAPLAGSGQIVDFWFQGEDNPEHFLIENRQRLGFDRNLPAEGLVVYHVDESVIGQRLHLNAINAGPVPGLRLVEADGDLDLVVGRNRGDANDPFPGAMSRTYLSDETEPSTRTFGGAATNISFAGVSHDGDRMRFDLQVRARGWLPSMDPGGPDILAYAPTGAASVSGLDDTGTACIVGSEYVGGRPQVTFRSGADWSAPIQLSASPAAAVDPALAVLPGGDLAVVWSDTRAGRAQLYTRSRIRGTWTGERQLLSLPGSCRAPAIGADARGGISLAFQYLEGDSIQIRHMYYSYLAPYGQSSRVIGGPQRPESPQVATAPDGWTWIAWEDRNPPLSLWFARFHPDSGLSAVLPLTLPLVYPQTSCSMAFDPDGVLHLVWIVSGPGLSELRYQRRSGPGMPTPIDQVVEFSGQGLLRPTLASDAESRLHLLFESLDTPGGGIRYQRRAPGGDWDATSTDLSYEEPPGGTRPLPLPGVEGNLAVAYLTRGVPESRLLIKQRVLSGTGPVAAPESRPGLVGRPAAGPNPLRAGTALEVWIPGPGGGAGIDVFDLAGRRVAGTGIHPTPAGGRARFDGTTTSSWAPGVYFAKPRDGGAPARFVVLH